MSKIEYVPSTPSQIYRSSLRLAHAHQYCASHTRVISGSEIDTLVNQNSHAAPIRSPVRGRTGFSESRGLRASVTFFPHPHPALSTSLPLPHFSRGPNFVHVVRERLLRRLASLQVCSLQVSHTGTRDILTFHAAIVISNIDPEMLACRSQSG